MKTTWAGVLMVVGGEVVPWIPALPVRFLPGTIRRRPGRFQVFLLPRVHMGSLIYDWEWLSSALQGTVTRLVPVA